MAEEFALVLSNRNDPQGPVPEPDDVIDVPITASTDAQTTPRPSTAFPEVKAAQKRSEGKSIAFLKAYQLGNNIGEHTPGTRAEDRETKRAFAQGLNDARKGRFPQYNAAGWLIDDEGVFRYGHTGWEEYDKSNFVKGSTGAMKGSEGRGTKAALAILGGAALAGLAAAFLSARSSGKKTAVKHPQLSNTPPAPTGFVPPAAPPVAEPLQSTPPARTSPAQPQPQPQPKYTPTPSNRPVSVPPITLNPTIRFDFGSSEWNPPQNTGIVPPVDFVQRPESTRTEVPDASEYFSPGEQRWLDAAGYSVNSEASPQEFGYVQTGDPLVPDLSPEQYSKMWLDAYNEGYKYGQRLKPGEAATKVVSLVHIDGQRAGFLGQPAKPPSGDADKAEYLQGYELGKAITDKAAGGVALVKAEASAWGSWDAVRGVPARSGPPAYHASAASA